MAECLDTSVTVLRDRIDEGASNVAPQSQPRLPCHGTSNSRHEEQIVPSRVTGLCAGAVETRSLR
jgi:hypothetical protein